MIARILVNPMAWIIVAVLIGAAVWGFIGFLKARDKEISPTRTSDHD